jgi:hypothetical protein
MLRLDRECFYCTIPETIWAIRKKLSSGLCFLLERFGMESNPECNILTQRVKGGGGRKKIDGVPYSQVQPPHAFKFIITYPYYILTSEPW